MDSVRIEDADTVPPVGGEGQVTLVSGRAFALSRRNGEFKEHADGFYFVDTRFLSRWSFGFRETPLEHLGLVNRDPLTALFIARARLGRGEVLVLRRRYVGRGLREDVEVRNVSRHPVAGTLRLVFHADFAHLFEVKSGRPPHRAAVLYTTDENWVEALNEPGDRGVRVVTGLRAAATGSSLRWEVELTPGQRWENCLEAIPIVESEVVATSFPCGTAVDAGTPWRQLDAWRADRARVDSSDRRIVTASTRALEDLAALRIFDTVHPDRAVVAAGAPWYMTMFGRDSLLTSWMALPFAPELARGVLLTLAELQGTIVDPATDQEPGKVLHEVRQSARGDLGVRSGDIYYGTVDATPLFVMTCGEAARWGAIDAADVTRLEPHVDAAIEWIERYGDTDGDGYVEYHRKSDHGLDNQGWKDSWDGVNFADGRLAAPPIALAEVQAYVYGAYLAAAALYRRVGRTADADRAEDRARRLREQFDRDFWLPEHGWYAIGLDGDKRPIDALTSNIGHCLWAGIVGDERVGEVTAALGSDSMRSGWGLRTLAATMGAYAPLSYHNGSVWPHDTTIAVAGLARYGSWELAWSLSNDLLDVAEHHHGRLPELFSGIDRRDVEMPVDYPSSCSPQAWAAASPLLLVRTFLGLEPSEGDLRVDPHLPRWMDRLSVSRLRQGTKVFGVEVDPLGARVDAPGIDVV